MAERVEQEDPGQIVPEETAPEIAPVVDVGDSEPGIDDIKAAPASPKHKPAPAPPATETAPPGRRGPGLLAVALVIWAVMVVLVIAMGGSFEPPTIALGIAGIALIFAIWRLFRMVQALSEQPEYGLDGARVTGANTRREDEFQRLLRALKELEFDHEMGKISEQDFSTLENSYRARAIDLMNELNLREDAAGTSKLHPKLQAELDRRERELRLSFSDSDLEVAQEPEEQGSKSCPKCQGTNDPDAKFCKHCGQELAA